MKVICLTWAGQSTNSATAAMVDAHLALDPVPKHAVFHVRLGLPVAITRGEHGNVGVFFRAPPRPESVVHERFAALVSAETALGRASELKEIAPVRSLTELAGLGGPHVDYLEPVVRRYTEALLRAIPES